MKRFLVGTAGHIDHGKTALVKALTGIDADRLPEEKRRGITIDLGFAHAQWEGVQVSFVDVPGHERFVRHMLAGAGGIDAVLLVVAADESVMPQTREHFEIVRLLGIRRGVVALTKTDRVTPEIVELASSEIADLVRGSFLAEAAVVPISSRTGEGLDLLRAALLDLAQEEAPSGREAGLVRLPIDRAFLIAGFGPVVTGSLVSGAISRDQRLDLLPGQRPVRVRRLEVHGEERPQARAGERVSANLAGVELQELERGLVLASPGAFAVSSLLTARVELLPGAGRLRSGDRVSFHHFASESRGLVRLLEARELAGGGSARAQLRLDTPIAAAPGDRFVLRRPSPAETIGGGLILDPLWPRARRGTAALGAALDRLEKGALSDRLALWIEQAGEGGAGEEDLARRGGVTSARVRAELSGPASSGRVHALRRSPDRYISEETLALLASRASEEIASLLLASGGSIGVPRRTLLSRLLPGSELRWAEAVETALAARGAFTLLGEEARVPGRDELPGREQDVSRRILAVYRERGLEPPSPAETATIVQHRLRVVEGLIGYLVRKGDLVRLPGGWIVGREAVDGVVARLRGSGRAAVDVGEFKEMFGLTRRLAIPLLEHLDASRVTRRVGDRREILGSRGEPPAHGA